MNLIKFSKNMTLSRAVRCLTIMGRTEKDQLSLSQYLYPSMQAVDIKELDLDIVHAGTDQRKIHMLVREVFPKLKWKVPVAVHQHLIPGLVNAEGPTDTTFTKMSKSNPKNSIFIHDSEEEIKSKIKLDDTSLKFKDKKYYYWSKTETKGNYGKNIRQLIDGSKPEEIYFDGNLEKKKCDSKYFGLGNISVSHCDKYMAYSLDLKGSEYYTIYLRNLNNNKICSGRKPMSARSGR